MTEKQKRFVEEYLIDLNAKQAAIRAGYSVKNADKIGSELLGKLEFSKRFQKPSRSGPAGLASIRIALSGNWPGLPSPIFPIL